MTESARLIRASRQVSIDDALWVAEGVIKWLEGAGSHHPGGCQDMTWDCLESRGYSVN